MHHRGRPVQRGDHGFPIHWHSLALSVRRVRGAARVRVDDGTRVRVREDHLRLAHEHPPAARHAGEAEGEVHAVLVRLALLEAGAGERRASAVGVDLQIRQAGQPGAAVALLRAGDPLGARGGGTAPRGDELTDGACHGDGGEGREDPHA